MCAVIDKAEPAVLMALTTNRTAEISGEGVRRLVEHSRRIAALRGIEDAARAVDMDPWHRKADGKAALAILDGNRRGDDLGRRGIAVLRFDDRAVGESGGMDGANKATTADAANPRPANANGHIIRWREESRDHAGTHFSWSLFLLAGPQADSRSPKGKPLDASNILATPKGSGRVWC